MSGHGVRVVHVVSALLMGASPLGAQAPPDVPLIRVGDVVVANLGDNSVSVLDGRTGALRGFVVEPGGEDPLPGPTGVAFGTDDALYVAASVGDRILRFDGATGAPRGVFAEGDPLIRPFSLIAGPGGEVWVSAGGAVLRYDVEGTFRGYAARDSALTQPIGLALGPGGLLYVANSTRARVDRFDPATGDWIDTFAADSLAFPSDVAFGPDGDLFVSSAGHRRVVRFDGATGAFRSVVATIPDGAPVGLAFAEDGRLLVGDFGGSRIFAVDLREGPLLSARLLADEGLARPENLALRPRLR